MSVLFRHYCYFLDKGSRFFWASVCNGCYYVLMMSTKVKNNCHFKYLWYWLSLRCHHIVGISKSESIDLLKNGDLMKTVDRYNCYNRYGHALLYSWIV